MALNAGKDGGPLANLSDREKRLLMAMLGVFALILTFIPLYMFQSAMDEIETDTETYRKALDVLATGAPEFLDRKASQAQATSHKTISDELLENNPVKLTSFVAGHAEAVKITVTSYDEDELPFGKSKSGDGPIIIENQLRVEIREAEMDALVNLMDRIEKSTDPVFIKRLDVRKHNAKNSKGKVRAVLTVSTFVKKAKES